MYIYLIVSLFLLSFVWALWSLKGEIKSHGKTHKNIGEEHIIFSMYKKR